MVKLVSAITVQVQIRVIVSHSYELLVDSGRVSSSKNCSNFAMSELYDRTVHNAEWHVTVTEYTTLTVDEL